PAGGLHRRLGLQDADAEAVVRDVIVDGAGLDVAVVGDDGDAVLVRLGDVGAGGGGVGRLDHEHLGAARERVLDLVELSRVVVVGGERERRQAELARGRLEVLLVLLVALFLQRREQEADARLAGVGRFGAAEAERRTNGDDREEEEAPHACLFLLLKESSSEAPTRIAPVKMSCQFEFTFMRFMPFDSVPKTSAPTTVPIMVARPPDSDVPPMTTAVMTCSSRMRPALPGVTPLVRAAATMPAPATHRPVNT